MPLIAGDPDATTGLAAVIRAEKLADTGTGALDNDALKLDSYRLAKAIVEYFLANTVVVGTCPAGAVVGTIT